MTSHRAGRLNATHCIIDDTTCLAGAAAAAAAISVTAGMHCSRRACPEFSEFLLFGDLSACAAIRLALHEM